MNLLAMQTFSIDENGNPTLVDGTPLTIPLLGWYFTGI